jgi:hypothetical protein
MSHIKAAYALATSNVPAALILEDDVTDELVPYWTHSTIDDFLTMSESKDVEAVQLSAQTSETAWELLLLGIKRVDWATNFVAPSDPSSSWLASNGAYLLTRLGALRLIKTFITDELLMNFTGLHCINVDVCLMPLLGSKYIRLPPMFTHGKMPVGSDPQSKETIVVYRSKDRKNIPIVDFTELNGYLEDSISESAYSYSESGEKRKSGSAQGAESEGSADNRSMYRSSIVEPGAAVHFGDQLYLNRVSRSYSMLMALSAFLDQPTHRVRYGKTFSKNRYYSPMGIAPPNIRPPPNFSMVS